MRHALSLLLALSLSAAAAQETPLSSTAQELIERERIRAAVEAAFDLHGQPTKGDGALRNDNIVNAAEQLVQIGSDAVPYLITELEQSRPSTFTFCAYALGRLKTPEAEAALRKAMRRADTEVGDFAYTKKAWAGYGLAMMNKVDVIDLFNQGQHVTGHLSIHFQTSVLELAALFTGRASLPLLYKQLDSYAEDERLSRERIWTLRALRRMPDPANVPKLLETMTEGNSAIRRESARALEWISIPESIDGLVALLETDEVPEVRFAAAWSLERLLPQDRLQTIVKRLDVEENPHVRGVLYRLVARLGGAGSLDVLKRHRGRADPSDRQGLIEAVRLIRDPATLELLRAALADPDVKVANEAVRGLGQLGGTEAIVPLVRQVSSQRWPLAQSAIRELVRLRADAAIEPISTRLVRRELTGQVKDPHQRERIYELGRAVVGLRHHAVLAELRPAAARQRDGHLVRFLDVVVRQLEGLEKNGNDVAAWIEALESADSEMRRLGYARLGEIGGEEAATALARVFGRVDVADGVAILEALGSVRAEASQKLIERALVSEAFDPIDRLPLRQMAAWSARKIGGERMIAALTASADRRSGREALVLVYLAVLAGERALPTLAAHRLPRLEYLKWTRGGEHDYLEWLRRQIQAERSLDRLDVPPAEINFNQPL